MEYVGNQWNSGTHLKEYSIATWAEVMRLTIYQVEMCELINDQCANMPGQASTSCYRSTVIRISQGEPKTHRKLFPLAMRALLLEFRHPFRPKPLPSYFSIVPPSLCPCCPSLFLNSSCSNKCYELSVEFIACLVCQSLRILELLYSIIIFDLGLLPSHPCGQIFNFLSSTDWICTEGHISR